MKKIVKMVTAVLTIIAALSLTTQAQTQIPTGQEPTVPTDVGIKGSDAVASYLLFKVDHVIIQYSGRSIVGNGWQDKYIDINTLRSLGYKHSGQFTELSDALFSQAYTGQVIETPDGGYEVNVKLTFYTSDNKIALQGSGYLPIYTDSYGGLSVGSFQPYVDINNLINFVQQGYVAGAKWTGKNGASLDLATGWDGNNSTITVPVGNLENGFLLFVDNYQQITGWDLTTGDTLSGRSIYAILGATSSSRIQSLRDPVKIDAMNQQFYASGDKIMGRYPLLDIVTSTGLYNVISFTVPVWGGSQAQGLAPSHIYWTPVYFSGNNNGYEIGKEYEIPKNSAGDFQPNIPANCGVHIRVQFDGLSDWSEMNSGGGVMIGRG